MSLMYRRQRSAPGDSGRSAKAACRSRSSHTTGAAVLAYCSMAKLMITVRGTGRRGLVVRDDLVVTTRICFVCSGNICRSPMAEVITRALLDDAGVPDVQVSSAGTGEWHQGEGANP